MHSISHPSDLLANYSVVMPVNHPVIKLASHPAKSTKPAILPTIEPYTQLASDLASLPVTWPANQPASQPALHPADDLTNNQPVI
jgi:hypothetical protein